MCYLKSDKITEIWSHRDEDFVSGSIPSTCIPDDLGKDCRTPEVKHYAYEEHLFSQATMFPAKCRSLCLGPVTCQLFDNYKKVSFVICSRSITSWVIVNTRIKIFQQIQYKVYINLAVLKHDELWLFWRRGERKERVMVWKGKYNINIIQCKLWILQILSDIPLLRYKLGLGKKDQLYKKTITF